MELTISQICSYPLKSGAPVVHVEAPITKCGLPHDRELMILHASTRELFSQRDSACNGQKLAVVKCRISQQELSLDAPGMTPLALQWTPPSADGQRIAAVLHGKSVAGVSIDPEVARWLEQYLEVEPYSLEVIRPDPAVFRSLSSTHIDYPLPMGDPSHKLSETASALFADGYTLLVTSEGSLREINKRLPPGVGPLPMSRFRPNLVLNDVVLASPPVPPELQELLSAGAVGIEDLLYEVQVGGNDGPLLRIVKPCSRCPITTVSQETGEFGVDRKEPLRTLAKYRTGAVLRSLFPSLDDDDARGVMFGENAVVVREGRVRMGDPVRVISWRTLY